MRKRTLNLTAVWRLGALLLLCACSFRWAQAEATLFLEEPYSYDGALAGTGHAAVYLDRVCAETPVKLRLCRADETGVVLSRYHRVAGYDWIAIPLVPYLYAVEKQEDIPLFADKKIGRISPRPLPARSSGNTNSRSPDGETPDRRLVRIGRSLLPPHHLRLSRLKPTPNWMPL